MATVTLTRSTSQKYASGTRSSDTLTVPVAPAVGALLIATCSGRLDPVTTLSDDGSDGWAIAVEQGIGDDYQAVFWKIADATDASSLTTITLTYSSAVINESFGVYSEFASDTGWPASPVDQTLSTADDGVEDTSHSIGPTGALAQSDELSIAQLFVRGDDGVTGVSIDNGTIFEQVPAVTLQMGSWTSWGHPHGTAALTVNASWTDTARSKMLLATFKPAAGGGTGATPTPATVAATAAVPAPTISSGSAVAPTQVAVTATVPAPTVSVGVTVTPSTVAATATVPTPSIPTETSPTPATVAGVAAVPTPTISTSVVVTPDVVAATATVPAPVASVSVTVTPAVVEGVATVSAVAAASVSVLPDVVGGVAAVPPPGINAGGNISIAAVTVSAVASIPTPTVSTGATVLPSAVAATVDVPVVVVSAGASVAPATVTVLATVPVPEITTIFGLGGDDILVLLSEVIVDWQFGPSHMSDWRLGIARESGSVE